MRGWRRERQRERDRERAGPLPLIKTAQPAECWLIHSLSTLTISLWGVESKAPVTSVQITRWTCWSRVTLISANQKTNSALHFYLNSRLSNCADRNPDGYEPSSVQNGIPGFHKACVWNCPSTEGQAPEHWCVLEQSNVFLSAPRVTVTSYHAMEVEIQLPHGD